jgi:hypothetical protein
LVAYRKYIKQFSFREQPGVFVCPGNAVWTSLHHDQASAFDWFTGLPEQRGPDIANATESWIFIGKSPFWDVV